MITRFKATDFTVFTDIEIQFSQGINIFIGANSTGKTHLMKAVYSACTLIDKNNDRTLAQKVNRVFQPISIGRLVHRAQGRKSGSFTVYRKNSDEQRERSIKLELSNLDKAEQKMNGWYDDNHVETVYIPVKDMLANAPGFRSLFSKRELTYEEVYMDIVDKAFLPIVRGKLSTEREKLLKHLHKVMDGSIVVKDETFYLKNKSGELEFPLLAEGFRKLGLLYRLIQNESLINGSILFWDEPEANLNPQLSEAIVSILLELQRMGVQIFIATHDYVLLKEFELATKTSDNVLYHALYKDNEGTVKHDSSEDIEMLISNAIDETYSRILDKELQKGFNL